MYSFIDHKTFVVNLRQLCSARALSLNPELHMKKPKLLMYISFILKNANT